MPRNAVVARRYVRALVAVTDEKPEGGQAHKVLLELKALHSVLSASKEIKSFFSSPVISKDEKKTALQDLKEKLPLTLKFLMALIDANRFGALADIVEEFESSLEAQSGEMSVSLETAHALSAAVLDEIKQSLEDRWKKKVKMTTTTNPNLIGGFVARAPGKILDASVAHQFQLLKQSLGIR